MPESPQQGVNPSGSGDEEGDVSLAGTTAFDDVPPTDDPADPPLGGNPDEGSSDPEPVGSGPDRVVADRGVSEVFEEIAGSSTGGAATPDDSSAAATEKNLEIREGDVNMDVGRDGAAGGDPDDGDGGRTEADDSDLRAALEDVSFDDEDDSSGIGAFVEEDESLLEQTGDDTHRAVGESDVDGVFDVFEECSPQDVMDSSADVADSATESDAGTAGSDTLSGSDPTSGVDPAEGAGDDVASLCSDLSGVDLEPDVPPDPPAGSGAASSTGASAGTSSSPDPEETAREVEGLLDDISTPEVDTDVEVDPDAGVTVDAGDLLEESSTAEADDPAESEPTVADPADAGGFQWLGEDVHILEGESDVDGMFDEFDESTPEEVMAADSDETPFFEAAATAETAADGWNSVPVDDGVDVSATDLYDTVEADPPSVVETGPDAGSSDDGTDAPSPDLDPLDPDPGAIDDAIDQALDGVDSGAETAGTAPDTSVGGSSTDDGEPGGASGPGDAPTGVGASTDAATDDGGPDPTSSPVATAGATPDVSGGGSVAGGTVGAGGVTGERDVDAVFERFEEETPEDVISSDDGTTGQDPVVAGVEDIAAVMGDLSTVELVPQTPTDDTPSGPVLDPGSEEAKAEVEVLLGDLGTVDLTPVDPDPEPDPEPASSSPAVETSAASADSEDVLERTGEDTHVAVGNSDVDAMFERFEEESPAEVAGGIESGTWEGVDASDESAGSTLGDASPDDLFDGVGTDDDSGRAAHREDADSSSPGGDIVEDATEHASDSGPAASTSERVSDALSGEDPPTVARRDEEAEPLFPDDGEDEKSDDEGEVLPQSTVGAVVERILDLGSRFRGLFF